jgi:peptidoglycan/LPS O-acetylase OafA/YrhL
MYSQSQSVSQRFGGLGRSALSVANSAHLDCIRSVAASAVMWGHLRALFFMDFHELTRHNSLLQVVYFLTGFGHQAVMVFFVLSGFLISSSILRSQASGTWSWAEYAISRATRLYVVLIPGLLFGTLWDSLGKSLFASSGLYSLPLTNFNGLVVQNALTAGNFFGNLFFLQTIACPTYGSNGPLWSISNEFWYYVLFPLGLLASLTWSKRNFVPAMVLTGPVLLISVILGPEKMIGFLVWMAGFAVVIAFARFRLSSHAKRGVYLFLCGSALIVCLFFSRVWKLTATVSDLAVGLAFSAFLFGVLQLNLRVMPAGIYLRGAHLFAGFSYSLYVLHFPFLLFLRAWIQPSHRWQPDGKHLAYGLGIGAITLTFSWLVALVTEYKTGEARTLVRRLLGISR